MNTSCKNNLLVYNDNEEFLYIIWTQILSNKFKFHNPQFALLVFDDYYSITFIKGNKWVYFRSDPITIITNDTIKTFHNLDDLLEYCNI